LERIKIDLDMVLPDIPGEKDQCVNRIVGELRGKDGIDKVHITAATTLAKAKLCFHYNPRIITVDRIRRLAEQAGAKITSRYHHLLLSVSGIRHQRHTRLIEHKLSSAEGILSVSVSGNGMLLLEYDREMINEEKVKALVLKAGLRIREAPQNSKLNQTDHPENGADQGQGGAHDPDGPQPGHPAGGIFGSRTELIFSLICGGLLGVGFGLSFVHSVPTILPIFLYAGAYFFGGFYTTKQAVQTLLKRRFEIDFLMLVAAIGAAVLGDWAEGALLLFLFSLGHALEHFAMEKARKSIAALTQLAPRTAFLKQDTGTREVPIEELKKGDIIIVKPNTKIAADGVVVEGYGSVNQAPITGESIPVDKTAFEGDINFNQINGIDAKHRVYAGTINGNDLLEVKVVKEASDSTLARLVKMVNEAQTQKSPTQNFTDKFERVFVPAVLILVTTLCFAWVVIDEPFSKSFYRAMSVLIAASPCALAISTPSAVLSGVARAARAGVLIKGGKPLEDLGVLTAMAFDKTGTLTEGRPKLTEVVPQGNHDARHLLKTVVAVEALSDHPIAKAIARDGKERLQGESIPPASDLQAVIGMGIKARIGEDEVYMGNLALFESLHENKPAENIVKSLHELEEKGNTTMLVRRNKEYIGIIAVMDTPRAEAKAALAALKEAGIRRMIMLTGDNQKVAEAVAAQIGITDVWGSLLPEQKVEAIRKLRQEEKGVAMVGDGVNDAPAMANSTIGIAMGAAGSDVALETADVALMGDKLSLLPFAIRLSRKARSIIKQNLVISLGMVAILVPLTILGIASMGPAVIAHEGSTLIVVFNALRLLAFKQ
jgi:Cd2+/Zn2+-exporting ATPase